MTLDLTTDFAKIKTFESNDRTMQQKFPSCWTPSEEIKKCRTGKEHFELREKILLTLTHFETNISHFFKNTIISMESRRDQILTDNNAICHVLRKRENKKIGFFNRKVRDLTDALETITPYVQKCIDTFFLVRGLTNPLTPEDISNCYNEIENCTNNRKELTELKQGIILRISDLFDKADSLSREGEKIGHPFRQDPAHYIKKKKIRTRKESPLHGLSFDQALNIMENIRAQQEILPLTKSIYFVYLNAIQAMRKMEKGLATILRGKIQEYSNQFPDPPAKESIALPPLVCPLSKQPFVNPVVTDTGDTYESKCVKKGTTRPNRLIKTLAEKTVFNPEDIECSICFEELRKNVVVLPSGTSYHAECVGTEDPISHETVTPIPNLTLMKYLEEIDALN